MDFVLTGGDCITSMHRLLFGHGPARWCIYTYGETSRRQRRGSDNSRPPSGADECPRVESLPISLQNRLRHRWSGQNPREKVLAAGTGRRPSAVDASGGGILNRSRERAPRARKTCFLRRVIRHLAPLGRLRAASLPGWRRPGDPQPSYSS